MLPFLFVIAPSVVLSVLSDHASRGERYGGDSFRISVCRRHPLTCLVEEVPDGRESMVEIIAKAFDEAGMSRLAPAAVVNAMAESSLDPKALGDRGQSVGLFQLYAKGAGAGMTVEERQDPRKNVARVIEEIEAHWGRRLRSMAVSGASHGEMIEVFCTDIMRPAQAEDKAKARRALGRMMFPTLVD